jgi:hypothetical protein
MEIRNKSGELTVGLPSSDKPDFLRQTSQWNNTHGSSSGGGNRLPNGLPDVKADKAALDAQLETPDKKKREQQALYGTTADQLKRSANSPLPDRGNYSADLAERTD